MVSRESERRASPGGQFGHCARMAKAQRRLEVGKVGKGSEGPVELVVGQRRTELRVERYYVISR
jgi:hypothetical protein